MSLRILGIDPGLSNTGWCILYCQEKELFLVEDLGTIKTSGKKDFEDRILFITDSLLEICKSNSISLVCAEDIFFTRNVSSSLLVAKVIGSFCYSFYKEFSLKVKLFTPTQIKSCISGVGNANKDLVKKTVLDQVQSKKEIVSSHEADSIACAVCYYYYLLYDMNKK